MKKTITCIILAFFAITLFAQTEYDSMLFDNSLLLKNGIYTSLKEVRSNTPKFPNCELEIGAIQDKINVDNLFYINSNNTRLKFEANLYATVINGRLFIFYKSQLNPIFLKAAISTFMIKEWVSVPANDADRSTVGNGQIKITMYFLDYTSGVIAKVDKKTLEPIITRDPALSASFKKIKKDPDNKKSFPFISKYNARHKVYVRTPHKTTISAE
ncbi:hypothetical protein [uncultured Cytophaga sp.]|uniref:hypothetical protein n=1 Tax=uncultured Cytophaga sp. TaxID=160238 RepID=UPI0026073C3B|nr:hypothetical protein [uncultured Cytophaga sp.]